MRKYLLAFLFLTAMHLQAQHKLAFDSSLTTAFEKAKKEDKGVFIDCQTKWCHWCRVVEKEIFTLDSVADFINEHFVPVSLDMGKGEGIAANKKFNVRAYPTFLVLNSEGDVLYRFLGYHPADIYMSHLRNGADPKSPMRNAIAAYKAGDRSKAVLRRFIQYSLNAYEDSTAKQEAVKYFTGLSHKERLLPENWFLFDKDDGVRLFGLYGKQFNYLADNWKDFARYNGKEKVEKRLLFNYEFIAMRTMVSFYAVKHPYNKSEFDHYRKQIKKTELREKEQLAAMLEIAQAAGEKDTMKVSELMVRYIPIFSTEQQRRWMDSYETMLEKIQDYKNLPYFRQVVEAVIKSNKDEKLVKEMMKYKE
jgi:thioredoxin-related protein